MPENGRDRLRELLEAVLKGTEGPADALCDLPESFVMSSVIAHVLTYSAYRRQLVRRMLTAAGREVDHGDPIT